MKAAWKDTYLGDAMVVQWENTWVVTKEMVRKAEWWEIQMEVNLAGKTVCTKDVYCWVVLTAGKSEAYEAVEKVAWLDVA